MRPRGDIAFLVASECRVALLRELSAEPKRPTELASAVSCARETVHRSLSGFVDNQWVEKSGHAYRTTAAGELVLAEYERLESTVERARELGTFLTELGEIATEIPEAALHSVSVTTATADDPHAPISRYSSWLGDQPVSSFRGMTPIASPVFNDAAQRVLGPETEMELIIDASVLDVSERAYPRALERAFEIEQFTLLRVANQIEFALAIVDGRVSVAAVDDRGNVVAGIHGDDDALHEWAIDVYERRRESAERVSVE
jgi:predicted transcriptional regulator